MALVPVMTKSTRTLVKLMGVALVIVPMNVTGGAPLARFAGRLTAIVGATTATLLLVVARVSMTVPLPLGSTWSRLVRTVSVPVGAPPAIETRKTVVLTAPAGSVKPPAGPKKPVMVLLLPPALLSLSGMRWKLPPPASYSRSI